MDELYGDLDDHSSGKTCFDTFRWQNNTLW